MSRPSIDETLMEIAYVWSRRGTCSRRHVGSVISDSRGVILSSGYNGAISGFPHCGPHEDYKPCEVSGHSERNAIDWAARRGVALEGSQIHVTDSPCPACARSIVQSGIQRVVYDRPYREEVGLLVLQAARIELVRFSDISERIFSE